MTNERPLPKELADLAAEVLAGGRITSSDVLKLRQGIFKDGVVDREEAELMFHLDAHSRNNEEAWNSFFVESLTDYFVWKQYPPGVLNDEDGTFLVERITHDGRIDRKTEFNLILDIIGKSQRCPEEVVLLALHAVKETVIEGGGVLFGKHRRRPGVIDAGDVEIVKKVVYGPGGGGSFTISRREAELLFELNNATVEKKNSPAWQELFVNAVGNYLMFPRGAAKVVDAEEARRRDAWLEERTGIGNGVISVLGQMAGEVSSMAAREGSAKERERAEAARKAEEAAGEAEKRKKVDKDEADWLIERITEDDILHDNERALLAYLKRQAPEVHPSLLSFFEKYDV